MREGKRDLRKLVEGLWIWRRCEEKKMVGYEMHSLVFDCFYYDVYEMNFGWIYVFRKDLFFQVGEWWVGDWVKECEIDGRAYEKWNWWDFQ
jgi:hypothetical protein